MSQLILSDNIPISYFCGNKKNFQKFFGDINNATQFIMFVF